MGKTTSISWTHHTFNPWWGCEKVSPGCAHCYAETMANRYGHVWGKDAPRRFFSEKHWREPLHWDRTAKQIGERRRVFCSSMADVFEEHTDRILLAPQRRRLFNLIEDTPYLEWLLLTKRPKNALDMVPVSWFDGFPPNVWIGTSVEDQERADERIPELLKIPARVRFLSVEPLLGPVNLVLQTVGGLPVNKHGIDWVIVGGESGPKARPCNVAWLRSIVEQCKAAGVPCFVKQLGSRPYVDQDTSTWPYGWGPNVECILGRPAPAHETYKLRDRKGADPSEWPEDLRAQEFPVGPESAR